MGLTEYSFLKTHQFSIILKQEVRDVGVTVFAGVGECGVSSSSLGVHKRSILKQVFDKIEVAFLGSLH